MSTPIEGIVIRITDEYSVILNVGREQGVKQGMIFVIYAEGEEIQDPVSKKNLGKYERIKARVIVVRAQEKFSLAKHAEREVVSATMSAIQALRGEFTVTKKLPVDEHDMSPIVVPDDSKIKVGDKVKEIRD